MTWICFQHYWNFMRGTMDFANKREKFVTMMAALWLALTSCWASNRVAGKLSLFYIQAGGFHKTVDLLHVPLTGWLFASFTNIFLPEILTRVYNQIQTFSVRFNQSPMPNFSVEYWAWISNYNTSRAAVIIELHPKRTLAELFSATQTKPLI